MKKNEYLQWASFRRQLLDRLQEKYKYLYKGVVLDIGGRDRGKFQKPKDQVENWIFADINEETKPDLILDISEMKQIGAETVDVVNAIELFEHVYDIKKGLKECFRVLKKDGILMLSTPFLYPIHADPYDFQRWTDYKWRIELKERGFSIQKFIIMGGFYTSLAEMLLLKLKDYRTKSFLGKILYYILRPIIDNIFKLDYKSSVKENPRLSKYHSGYFIIAEKK